MEKHKYESIPSTFVDSCDDKNATNASNKNAGNNLEKYNVLEKLDEILYNAGHGFGTMILMFDGTKKAIQHIIKGDQLMGQNSKPVKVLATRQRTCKMYRVIIEHCEPFTCKMNHVVVVIFTKTIYENNVTRSYPPKFNTQIITADATIPVLQSGNHFMFSRSVSPFGGDEFYSRYCVLQKQWKENKTNDSSVILPKIKSDDPYETAEIARSLGYSANVVNNVVDIYLDKSILLSGNYQKHTIKHPQIGVLSHPDPNKIYYKSFEVQYLPENQCYEMSTSDRYFLGNYIVTGGILSKQKQGE